MAEAAIQREPIVMAATDRPAIPDDIASIIASPRAHADGRLLEAFGWLRRNQPFGIAHPEGFDPFWVATRQRDIRELAMKPDLFRSEQANITLASRDQLDRMRQLTGRENPVRAIVNMDPPDHPKYRAVAAGFFHPRNIDMLAAEIRRIAVSFVDRLADMGGECDFAREIGFLYPLHVIMGILGVPPEDELLMLRLTQEYMGAADEDLSRDGRMDGASLGESMAQIAAEMNAYFDALLDERRRRPGSDLVSVIANALIDGDPMPALEARSYCFVAATAGHDTTSSTINGGVHALTQHPGLLDAIRGDEDRIRAFVEEAIRVYPPSKMTMRAASRDCTVAGRSIREGDWVGLAWASANNDEEVFPDPELFRIDRRPNKLLSFGNGPHVCIGQHLARLEMRILFDELSRRIDHIEMAGESRSMASFMVSGIKSLPIRYRLK